MKRAKLHSEPITTLAVVALLAGCTQKIESDPEAGAIEAASLSLASPSPTSAVASGYQTYLYSEQDVEIYNRLAGGGFYEQGITVEVIHVEVGDRVGTGQLLATLEDDEVLIRVEAAKARVDEATATFQRIEELRQKDIVSQAEYDEALATKRLAEAELASARLDLSRTRVRAPFSGVVARRYVREGELVDFGMGLFRVTAMAPLRARLRVPETEVAPFASGASVEVTGTDGATAVARVIVVGPTIDPASGTREVVVELSEPDGFRPGAAIVARPMPLQEGE